MDDYVYALHDFVPENDDEVPFKAGERIQVIERDDLYGDGWWQGKNLAGKIGLFPKSYTQPAPAEPAPKPVPTSSTLDASLSPQPQLSTPPSGTLHPLKEEPEPPQSNGATTPNGSIARGEVMQATLTDVQQAIEQLGTNQDMDGARSFTDSTDHETDHDTEGESDADGEWYKITRQKLAERARQQVEQAQRDREASEHRLSVPPIDVELSDESGDDEQDADSEIDTQRLRRHPHIPEEDENEGAFAHIAFMSKNDDQSPFVIPSESYIVPSPSKPDLPTATQPTFPHIEEQRPSRAASASPAPITSPSSHKRSFSLGGSRPPSTTPERPSEQPTPTPSAATVHAVAPQVTVPLPSPSPSHFHQSLGSTSSSTKFGASSPLSQSQTIQDSLLSPTSFSARKPSSHPSDWSVEEVVDWLKSKGFDDGVCDKFIEQEITGDVLLELDVNVLKTEIGIIAFGKRMRIANAITELRRPPSIISSDHNQPLRSHSQSQSVSQSFTGSASTRQSLNSPFGLPPISPAYSTGLNTFSPESPPHTGDIAGTPAERPRRDSDPGAGPAISVSDSQDTVGLGLGIPDALVPGRSSSVGVPASLIPSNKGSKGRPSQLTLSPSDSALGASVKAVSGETAEPADEQREVMSESETAQAVEARSKRKRFVRQGSASSKDTKDKDKDKDKDNSSRNSRDAPPDGGSPSEPTRNPRKRSAESSNRSPQERHSLFGAAFSGTLGKSRKPPPRYSVADVDSPAPEKSTMSLSRLVPGSGRKSSGRPSTSDGSPTSSTLRTKDKDDKEKKKERRDSKDSAEKEKRDPALLRKRTTSTAEAPMLGSGTVRNPNNLKAGQSILQQIGAPDFNGWMRKKGDRYNAWKNRYFVLKGPHLYWLRSNSTSETRIKGYVNIVGYHIVTDEKIDPGRYGFKLVHDSDKTHMFSSDEQTVIREWMKALMKATIDRDYTKPVVSSVNIPTIPLTVAQAMNPAPRPPSPSARAATQKALRRENTNQLSTRDAQILMGGVPSEPQGQPKDERTPLESVFTNDTASSSDVTAKSGPSPPTRPSRELRRALSTQTQLSDKTTIDPSLIEWANSHLPTALQITDTSGAICGGLALLRLAESIKGSPCSPPVPDVAFPSGPEDDKLEGLFRLFDFLLDNDVRMGAVSINDIKLGKRDKTVQLLRALRTWEEKRRAITQSIGKSGMHAGPFVAPVAWNQ